MYRDIWGAENCPESETNLRKRLWLIIRYCSRNSLRPSLILRSHWVIDIAMSRNSLLLTCLLLTTRFDKSSVFKVFHLKTNQTPFVRSVYHIIPSKSSPFLYTLTPYRNELLGRGRKMKNRRLALTNVLLPISCLDTKFNVKNCSFSAIMGIQTGCTIRKRHHFCRRLT